MGRSRTDAKEKSLRTVNALSRDMRKIGKFLVDVVTGEVKDEFEKEKKDKDGNVTVEKITRAATLAVRVSAAKQYKELIIDKLLPDTKDNPKQKETPKSKVSEAIESLEAEIQKAKASSN